MADQPKDKGGSQRAAGQAKTPSGGGGLAASLFGGGKKAATGGPQVSDLTTEINAASTRLRILEERYENLRKKILVIEHNMLQNNKKVMAEIRASDDQVKEFGHVIEQMKEELKLIIRELKLTAKSDEMEQLKRYISVWEPLNFVTRNEVKKLIGDIIEEKIPELAQKGFFEEEIRKAMKGAMNKSKK